MDQAVVPGSPPAAKRSTPLWVMASWLAPVFGIGGNVFTTPVLMSFGQTLVGNLLGALLGLFWSLFVLAGMGCGVVAIIKGIGRREPSWILQGLVGVAIGTVLIIGAAAGMASRSHHTAHESRAASAGLKSAQ